MIEGRRVRNAAGDASQNAVEGDSAEERVWRASFRKEFSCTCVSVDDGPVRVRGGAEERLLLSAAFAPGPEVYEETLERAEFAAGGGLRRGEDENDAGRSSRPVSRRIYRDVHL